MKFVFSPALTAYVQEKKQYGVIVEISHSDSSDFEVTELHPHFVSQKQADIFVRAKGFHPMETELCTVLLPNYVLDYDEIITFDLRSFGPIRWVTVKGIKL